MERSCEELRQALPVYLEGGMKEHDASFFEEQINNCPEIAAEVKLYQQLESDLSQHGNLEVPMATDEFFYSKLEEGAKVREVNFGWWHIAAGIALLLIGGLVGSQFAAGSGDETDIANLRRDVIEMKQLMVSAMLEEHSAMDRIKAVSYTDDMEMPDLEVINVLVKSLKLDKSPNVRIAAANALEKWNELPVVRAELVRAMDFQEDPIVQITLINMLINIGEKSAIKPFRKIVDDEAIEELVRKQAQIGIEVLI